MVKTLMSVQNVIHPKPTPHPVEVTGDIDSLYDGATDTFRLIDQPNASFLQVPKWTCDKNTKIVVTVLTALKNFEQRDQLRRLVKEVEEVSVLFLLMSLSLRLLLMRLPQRLLQSLQLERNWSLSAQRSSTTHQLAPSF